MKKFILSCFVFLAGVVGAIGWLIACAAKVDGGISTVLACVYGMDWAFIVAFLLLALAGLILAVMEAGKEK